MGFDRGPRRFPNLFRINKSLISSAWVNPSKNMYITGIIKSDIKSPRIVLGTNKRHNPNINDETVIFSRFMYGNFVSVTLMVFEVVRTITMKEASIVAIAAPFKPYIGTNITVRIRLLAVPIARKNIAGYGFPAAWRTLADIP